MPEAPKTKTLALIDASGYLYRAYHAIRGLSGPGGRPTNATLGFANMLRKFLSDRKPAAVAVCFDRREKTFRHEMDAEYKAQRQPMPEDLAPQIEDTKRLCREMGLAVLEEPGFEADDLIGTLAERARRLSLAVEVATADKDMFQLVGEGVTVWHATQERVLDAAGVKEVFGVAPERVVDVLALMGDSSDNIPGVAGIGEKGARELVNAYGPLEGIYERLGELKGKRRECLEKGREDAFRSRELARLHTEAPVPGDGDDAAALLARFRPRELGAEEARSLAAFYDELGFSKLKKELLESNAPASVRVQAGLFEEAPEGSPAAGGPAVVASGARPDLPAARWAEGRELEDLVRSALAGERLALHVEAAPGRPYPPIPLAAAFARAGGETVAFSLEGEGGRAAFAKLVSGGGLVAHEAKRLFLASLALGLPFPERFEDVMLGSYVVSPGLHAHDLEGDVRAVLGRSPDSVPTRKEAAGAAGFSSSAELRSEGALRYLGARAALPLELHAALEAGLGDAALRKVLDTIEKPLVPVLARMEWTGIAVDQGALAGLSGDFARRLLTLENRIHGEAGETFNVGSPLQLGRVLFEKLGYPVLRKTSKTKSYSTDSEVLEELAAQGTGPLPGLVLEWRELSKLKGTYVDALPHHVAADGRVHTRYDQAVAATGRLSSNDPNLQNIPVRTEAGRAIRRAFVAPPGRLLVSADYSQVELRLLAHLSGDEALQEVFRRGEDIHRATAARIFGIDPGLVSADQRRGAKTINFGILYGMGPFALAAQLGVKQAEAKAFIQAYFQRFPKIRACLDGILASARATGKTETLFGRVRPIPGLAERNYAVRANAERMAMNAPFQGTAADLIKLAMIRLHAALAGGDGAAAAEGGSARLLLSVHDELVVECDAGEAARVAEVARKAMEGAASLSVPLTVDVGTGGSWAEVH